MKQEQLISDALLSTLMSPNVMDSNLESANVVDVIDSLAKSVRFAAKHLGNGDASTGLGALEAHGMAIVKASETIADAIRDLADAIREIKND